MWAHSKSHTELLHCPECTVRSTSLSLLSSSPGHHWLHHSLSQFVSQLLWKTLTQTNLGKKGFIQLRGYSTLFGNTKSETESKNSSWDMAFSGSLSCLLASRQTHLSRDGIAYRRLCPSTTNRGDYQGERSGCGEKLGSVDEGEREIRK